jgi:hypothetical protein
MRLALALIILIGAAGCAQVPPCVPAVVPPPVVYLQDVPEPVFRGTTNADLAQHVLDLRAAVRRSNLDKARLREFYADQPDPR